MASLKHLHQCRALIVDDVESNLYVVEGILTAYGIVSDTAHSGMETVAKIKAGELYDIIFMDYIMPDMDGIVTTKILRGMGCTIPIVALTANINEDNEKLFSSSGFSGFVSKPIDIKHFDAYLRQFIPSANFPPLDELIKNMPL